MHCIVEKSEHLKCLYLLFFLADKKNVKTLSSQFFKIYVRLLLLLINTYINVYQAYPN